MLLLVNSASCMHCLTHLRCLCMMMMVQESLESALADVRKAVAQVCAAELENEQAQQRRDSDVSPVAAASVASTKRAGSVRSTGESVATRA